MRITVAYNLRTEDTEEHAELLSQEDVDRICNALTQLKHKVAPVEVSGKPNDVVNRLLASEPDLIFNVAEGTIGSSREAFFPGLYEQLGIPFTGGNASLLHMNLDKHLAKTVVASRGIAVPKGVLITSENFKFPKNLKFPIILKPNSEGSSKGITQDSVAENLAQLKTILKRLLKSYPLGIVAEEFISGRELSVPFLESYPGQLLEIVEHTFDLKKAGGKYNIYDYYMKQGGEAAAAVKAICPPVLSSEERKAVLIIARKVFDEMNCPDFGRVDIRLHENGTPYFIELNPLPSLHPVASLMTAAKVGGLDYKDVINLIIKSAAKRYKLPTRSVAKSVFSASSSPIARPTAREIGITVGRFPTGLNNAITDVKGVKVGHITRIQQDVSIPGVKGKTAICTGLTAVIPAAGDLFNRRVVAGGYVLNGVGEMAGLNQVLEWGLLESPIFLTNSVSVGSIHRGYVSHTSAKYSENEFEHNIILPVVGEADDSFLNDIRIGHNDESLVSKVLSAAKSGPVEQGSVGAGSGMISFDFAGGIGTSSRVIQMANHSFNLGVLVMSNLGRMQNLTVEGAVVGKQLDPIFDYPRRKESYGSIIVAIATDAPLLSGQLSRLAKRAALGLGRVGSYAATTSGEIIIAFSSANRLPCSSKAGSRILQLHTISDTILDMMYEAVIEATEEAVLNAMFCSQGVTGRDDRMVPAIPQEEVIRILANGRKLNAGNS